MSTPKIGVGIHYRAETLTPDIFLNWCFDNIGEPQTTRDAIIICGDHPRGVFFSFAPQLRKIRIGVFGEYTQESAWKAIDEWARRFVSECGVELEAIEHDLFEDGKGKVGHWVFPLGAKNVVDVPVAAKPIETRRKVRMC